MMMQLHELVHRYEPLRQVRQLEHSNHSTNSETSIFLGINISIVVVLLICILGYCYFFRNRFDAIIRHQLELNDQALEQNIRDRQLERERVLAAAQQRTHRPTNNTDNDVTAAVNDNYDVENEESTDSRRALLVDSFSRNKVTMVVTEDDFCNETSEHWTNKDEELHEIMEANITVTSGGDSNDTNVPLESTNDNYSNVNNNTSLEEGEIRYLWIGHCCHDDPSSTTSMSTEAVSSAQPPPPPQRRRRRVPNCCAICLAPYEVNETVVWSCCHGQTSNSKTNNNNDKATNNTGCNHAFHYDCMIDWLIKVQDGTPCPCCRQEFTDLPINTRRRKLNATQQQLQEQLQLDRLRNFDLAVFSFR